MENMPSPARAERNQARKLEFVPVWPLLAGILLALVLVIAFH
jgi:type VI protein secretion system component VasF